MIIAPSFGDIFRSNAAQTGIVLVELPEEQVKELMESVDLDRGSELVVDLEALTVTTPAGKMLPFEFDESTRYRLLNGLDDIGITLQHADEITAYERPDRSHDRIPPSSSAGARAHACDTGTSIACRPIAAERRPVQSVTRCGPARGVA